MWLIYYGPTRVKYMSVTESFSPAAAQWPKVTTNNESPQSQGTMMAGEDSFDVGLTASESSSGFHGEATAHSSPKVDFSQYQVGQHHSKQQKLNDLYQLCEPLANAGLREEEVQKTFQTLLEKVIECEGELKNEVQYIVLLHFLNSHIDGEADDQTLHFLIAEQPFETCICMLMLDHETAIYPTHVLAQKLDGLVSHDVTLIEPWLSHPLITNVRCTLYAYINVLILSENGLKRVDLLQSKVSASSDRTNRSSSALAGSETGTAEYELSADSAIEPLEKEQGIEFFNDAATELALRKKRNLASLPKYYIDVVSLQARLGSRNKVKVTYSMLVKLREDVLQSKDPSLMNAWLYCAQRFLVRMGGNLHFEEFTSLRNDTQAFASQMFSEREQAIETAEELLREIVIQLSKVKPHSTGEIVSYTENKKSELTEASHKTSMDLAIRKQWLAYIQPCSVPSELAFEDEFDQQWPDSITVGEKFDWIDKRVKEGKSALAILMFDFEDVEQVQDKAQTSQALNSLKWLQEQVKDKRQQLQQQQQQLKLDTAQALYFYEASCSQSTPQLAREMAKLEIQLAHLVPNSKNNKQLCQLPVHIPNHLCYASAKMCEGYVVDELLTANGLIIGLAYLLRSGGVGSFSAEQKEILKPMQGQIIKDNLPILYQLTSELLKSEQPNFESVLTKKFQTARLAKVAHYGEPQDCMISVWFALTAKLVSAEFLDEALKDATWLKGNGKVFIKKMILAYKLDVDFLDDSMKQLEQEAVKADPHAQCRLVDWHIEHPISPKVAKSLCYRYLMMPSVFHTHERLLYQGVVLVIGLGCQQDVEKGKDFMMQALKSESCIPKLRLVQLLTTVTNSELKLSFENNDLLSLARQLKESKDNVQELLMCVPVKERISIVELLRKESNKSNRLTRSEGNDFQFAADALLFEQELLDELKLISEDERSLFQPHKVIEWLSTLKRCQKERFPDVNQTILLNLIKLIPITTDNLMLMESLINSIKDEKEKTKVLRHILFSRSHQLEMNKLGTSIGGLVNCLPSDFSLSDTDLPRLRTIIIAAWSDCHPRLKSVLTCNLNPTIIPKLVSDIPLTAKNFPKLMVLVSLIKDPCVQSAERKKIFSRPNGALTSSIYSLFNQQKGYLLSLESLIISEMISCIPVTDTYLELLVSLICAINDEVGAEERIRALLFSSENQKNLKTLGKYCSSLVRGLPNYFVFTEDDISTLLFITSSNSPYIQDELEVLLLRKENFSALEQLLHFNRCITPALNPKIFSHYLQRAVLVDDRIVEWIWNESHETQSLLNESFEHFYPNSLQPKNTGYRCKMIVGHPSLTTQESIQYFNKLSIEEKKVMLGELKHQFLSSSIAEAFLSTCDKAPNVTTSKAKHHISSLLSEISPSNFKRFYSYYLFAKMYELPDLVNLQLKLNIISEHIIERADVGEERCWAEAYLWQQK